MASSSSASKSDPSSEAAAPRLWTPRWARLWALAGLAYAGLVTIGLVVFLARDPVVSTESVPVPVEQRASGEVNVALVYSGARLVVSSYDLFRSHHPLFAIDGDPAPAQVQKWASLDDPAPWIEVHFAGPVDVGRVVLVLAGAFEPAEYSMSDFDVRCLRAGEPQAERSVTGNTDARVELELACAQADAVRVDFTVYEDGPLQVVRLYELEVWGRPAP